MSATQQPSPPWKPLAFYLGLRSHGDVVSHEIISSILGMEYPGQPYYSNVRMAILNQLRRKRHWALERGTGYRLLFPHEIHLLASAHVSAAKQAVQRGADVLLNRDSAALPRAFDQSYSQGEGALRALCDQIECFEQTTRLVGAQKRVFDTLKECAIRATSQWRGIQARAGAGRASNRSVTTWEPFVCQGCQTLLMKHVGVVGSSGVALEMVCRRCKKTNILFGAGGGAALAMELGAVSSVVDR